MLTSNPSAGPGKTKFINVKALITRLLQAVIRIGVVLYLIMQGLRVVSKLIFVVVRRELLMLKGSESSHIKLNCCHNKH